MDTAEEINQCYSTNTVVYVTVSFILAMFGIFFETKELFYNYKSEMNFSTMATSYILWALQNTIIIFLLLQVCEMTREKAYDAAMIVHEILQVNPVFLQHSNVFCNKMKSFSLHLLHRKKTFNFSGQGLFIFDYTFIFSVSFFWKNRAARKLICYLIFNFILFVPQAISAGASYLIVLLQFDMSFGRDKNAWKMDAIGRFKSSVAANCINFSLLTFHMVDKCIKKYKCFCKTSCYILCKLVTDLTRWR